jgi:hypothetical protein
MTRKFVTPRKIVLDGSKSETQIGHAKKDIGNIAG